MNNLFFVDFLPVLPVFNVFLSCLLTVLNQKQEIDQLYKVHPLTYISRLMIIVSDRYIILNMKGSQSK